MALNLLIVEGNTHEDREIYREGIGATAGETYAATLRRIAPDASCEICLPADAGARLPGPSGLADYDAVLLTGSALNLYDGGPAIERQVELARAVFASGTPFFGSCWGLQVATAAAGGNVRRNPRGREIGLARDIRPTEAGRAHPLLAGKPGAYDAMCSHLDIVDLPPGAVALAGNTAAPVQAAEIVFAGGRFWGVQYHPEYTFAELAALIARRATSLALEGRFADETTAVAYADDLRSLDDGAAKADVARRLGVGAEVLDPSQRRVELANFIESWARPVKSERGRA